MKTLKELFTGEKKKERMGQGVHNNENSPVNEPKTQYYCPMKCEGEKTYNVPGNCPVCNMILVPVDSRKGSHGHSHSHSHGCC